MAKRKSWQDKLNSGKQPQVKTLTFDFAGLKAGSTMLVSTPEEIRAQINRIPVGQQVSLDDLRALLAKQHQAQATCPASTAIFARIVAEVALEEFRAGQAIEQITPFWRVIDAKHNIAKKMEGAAEIITHLRQYEGIEPSTK